MTDKPKKHRVRVSKRPHKQLPGRTATGQFAAGNSEAESKPGSGSNSAESFSDQVAAIANKRRIARALVRAAHRGEPNAVERVLRMIETRTSKPAPSGSLKRLTVAELGVLKVLIAKSEGREHPASEVATTLISLAIETLRPDLCSAGISYLAARVTEFITDYEPGKTKAAILSIVPNADDAEATPETAEAKPMDGRRSTRVHRVKSNRRK